ncbi:sensor histidine kinase [Gorillibacterium massiliense]|uniref:sensor histidine kinase n=1 Tax=Gorillibacterium massiliense TaxID=1280390 RepID=UPI0004B5B642|nr:HAMP domain-containing sensor histidine kinase [Gorillibacterium massiliense]
MKSRITRIGNKLILTLFLSALAASAFIAALCGILIALSDIKPFAQFFFDHILLFFFGFITIFIIVLIVTFYLLTAKRIAYLEQITRGVEELSQGNLDQQIPMQGSDELGILASSINDMSRRMKNLIDQERENERAKNELITDISHDLRTPLTSVLGFLQLIACGSSDDGKTSQHYADVAYAKCINLKRRIDDLFEYSKLNSPKMKINELSFNLSELIEQVVLGFIPVFNENGMEYRISLPNRRIVLSADPLLFSRMLENIINNAVIYGKEGKLIEISLTQVERDAVITIANYGNTIPDKDLPKIFEKFYRADNSRTSEGTGLGLAIAKAIAEKHCGIISAFCADGKTTFNLRFEMKGISNSI